MATRRQKRDTALFAGSAVTFLVLAVMTGGAWCFVAAGCLGATTAIRLGQYHRKPRTRPMPPKARRQPQRRSPRQPQQVRLVAPAAPKRVGTRACSAACQRSTKPAHTCDCSCGGRSHGAMVKGTRASLLTAEARRAERDAKRRGPVRVVPSAQRPAASVKAATPAKVGAPSRREVPLRSPDERRGWKSLQTSGKQAMAAHAKASPRCLKGSVTARTVRDRRTSPPTVTQSLTCDTCGAALT